jgi:hypothetical protein
MSVLFLLVVLEWAVSSIWTAQAGLLWHLFHGNYAWFNGNKVQVPWDMWVQRPADDTLMIVREAPKYPILRSPAGTIIIGRFPGPAVDMSKDYRRFASANERARDGYQLRGVNKIKTEKGLGYCWELVRTDVSNVSISCQFDNDTLTAGFEGSLAYRTRFYDAIETASRGLLQTNQP